MDKNFHNFYRLLSSKLSEGGLDGIMPVGIEEGPSMDVPPYCFEEECYTWSSTLVPFTAALLWFERLGVATYRQLITNLQSRMP